MQRTLRYSKRERQAGRMRMVAVIYAKLISHPSRPDICDFAEIERCGGVCRGDMPIALRFIVYYALWKMFLYLNSRRHVPDTTTTTTKNSNKNIYNKKATIQAMQIWSACRRIPSLPPCGVYGVIESMSSHLYLITHTLPLTLTLTASASASAYPQQSL